MTSRTKRRLAVLALALGLIAAAPGGFRAAVDFKLGLALGKHAAIKFQTNLVSSRERLMLVRTPIFDTQYISAPETSTLLLLGPRGFRKFSLPPDYITLRVACAAALAGTWLLVIGGRSLVRRWTRKNPPSMAV